MTDTDALLEAVALLGSIASVAGGYVSRDQRAAIDRLRAHAQPEGERRMIAAGWQHENAQLVLRRVA